MHNKKTSRLHGLLRLLSVSGVLLLVLIGLTACQPAFLVNQLTPRDGFVVERDLVYGPDPRHRLDLYIPTARPLKQAVVVFVHGGGWDSGSKDQYLFIGQAFSSLGYITAIPNYRLYPQVQFPGFVDDVARSIAALRPLLSDEACRGDLKVILAGHSAGAHTAALLVTDGRFLTRNRVDVDLRAFIGLAGPYDLPLDDPAVVGKFDTLTHDTEANPVALADRGVPPTLLIHGDADVTVGLHHTQRLSAKLKRVGVSTSVKVYSGTNHIRVIGSLASPLRFLTPAFDDIERFLRSEHLDEDCRQAVDNVARRSCLGCASRSVNRP